MDKGQKYTLLDINGKAKAPKPTSIKLHTICAIHQQLAFELDCLFPDSKEKRRFLKMIDRSYDMGKRMGERLRDYHHEQKKEGGWRDDL